jgi:hypothetical protein
MLMAETPISTAELLRRGMDDALADLMASAIGETLPARCSGFTKCEMAALGYGKPCECGERGLGIDEAECRDCIGSTAGSRE